MTAQEHAERIARALEAIDAIEPEGNMLTLAQRADRQTRSMRATMAYIEAGTPQAAKALLSERTALLARVVELEKALGELVDLKDMKDRLKDLHERGHGTDYENYYRRKPLAWDSARAALKGQP